MKWDLKAPAADVAALSRSAVAPVAFFRPASVALPGLRGCPPSIQAMTSTTNRTATTKENIS